MSRKSIALLVASHMLVIIVGVLLARQAASAPDGNAASHEAAAKPEGSAFSGRGPRKVSASFRPSKEWHGSEYARAWKAIRTAKLTTKDRVQTQRDLLKKWAEVDLTAAIEAALGEEWDGDERGYYNNRGPFLDVFGDAFGKNPQEGWDMIRGRRFGLATGMLRNVWINAVGHNDPLFLAARIGELSWRDKDEALSACQVGAYDAGREQVRADLLKVLANFPADVVTAEQLSLFEDRRRDGASMEDLKAEIIGLENQRMAEVKAIGFGRMLADQSPGEVAASIQGLPDRLKTEVVWSTISNGRISSAEKLTGLLDLLVGQNAWDKLGESRVVGRLQEACRRGEAWQVAEWAATMPCREETSELFYRSVETYLRDNMDASREWISGIQSREWRNRAYAEYSQQALNAHNDPAASRWALDQISNPEYKAVAEGWRKSWEQKTGWNAK